MDNKSQKVLAQEFLDMHSRKPMLRLANAWDAASAKVFERAGFKAIGTTSSGMASSLGYPDGENVKLEELMPLIRRIVKTTSLPVSVDLESGYGSSITSAVRAAEQILDLGAVGINLEDVDRSGNQNMFDSDFQSKKIEAIRQMASARDVPLVINARTDVFLVSKKTKEEQFSEVIQRGNAYRQAGADCIFVVGTGGLKLAQLEKLVQDIEAPINIFVGPSHPPLEELEKIGVARVSFGSQPMRALLGKLDLIANDLITSGSLAHMFEKTFPEDEVDGWFSP